MEKRVLGPDNVTEFLQTYPLEGRSGWPAWYLPERHRRKGKITPEMLGAVSCAASHALSPDGETVAFLWHRDETSDIWTMPVQGGWPERLTFGRPLVSQSLLRWRVDYGAPCWSPDGRWIVYGTEVPLKVGAGGEIWVVPAQGGVPECISDGAGASGQPRVSPDSRWVVYVASRSEHSRLVLSELGGRRRHELDTGPLSVSDPQWSPDGQALVFLTQPMTDLHTQEIWRTSVPDGTATALTPGSKAGIRSPRWSPDGQWIAYACNQTGYFELYWIPAAGGTPEQLTRLNRDVNEIQWSPDGTRIAFVVTYQGSRQVYVLPAGGGVSRQLTDDEGIHMRPQWTPDGKWLVTGYQSPLQPHDLFVISAEGGARRQLTFSMLPALRQAGLVIPQRVSYRSYDGLEIPSFLFLPQAKEGRRFPALVYPHEGPTAQYGMEWHPELQFFVSKGYAVLCPNFRGSTGYGKVHEDLEHYDWGRGDLQDILYGADYLRTLPKIDPDRLAVWGSSYGGYLGPLAVMADSERFKAAVAMYGDCNLLTSWAEGEYGGSLDLDRQMGNPTFHRADYEAGSPIHLVHQLQAPLLILHGMDDDCVSVLQSVELVEGLRRAGKRFEYRFYPGEGHGFQKREHVIDVYRRSERFLDWYLL